MSCDSISGLLVPAVSEQLETRYGRAAALLVDAAARFEMRLGLYRQEMVTTMAAVKYSFVIIYVVWLWGRRGSCE
eukprot:scaffold105893_cov36-Cyclotella_meneghiniana.AAC.1